MQDQYEKLAQRDNDIMLTMKLDDIAHVLAYTSKGILMIKLFKGQKGKDYRFVLDSVPFSDKDNSILLDLFSGMLFDLK